MGIFYICRLCDPPCRLIYEQSGGPYMCIYDGERGPGWKEIPERDFIEDLIILEAYKNEIKAHQKG